MSLNQCLEKVGTVSEDEKNEILGLFERMMGLKELLLILEAGDNHKSLYDSAVKDLGTNTIKQKNWWNHMANKYKWKGKEGATWRIDFDDNAIYLYDASSM